MNMLAEKLRAKRKELGLSQKALSKGICEQSQISKMERGNFMPSADLLFKLSQRLEVPLDYFFNEQIEVKSNLSKFKNLSARLLDDRNYDDLAYIYNLEMEKTGFLSIEDKLYLEWIRAILEFYKDDRKELALSRLEKVVTKLSPETILYLKVLNTLSNFYSLIGDEESYEANYQLLLQLYQKKNLEDKQEFLFGYLRVRYNYAHYLQTKERFYEAMQEALETIEVCKRNYTTYQLVPLLILVGNAGAQFLDLEQVKDYFIQARELCKIYPNPLLLAKIDNYLNEMKKDDEV